MLTKETEEGIKTMCTVISVDKGGPATMFDAFEAAENRGEAVVKLLVRKKAKNQL